MTGTSDQFGDDDFDILNEAVVPSPINEHPITIHKFDPRLKLMSYSSLGVLHKCPRKYQLYRLKAVDDEMDPLAQSNQTLTFCFGHTVGEGIEAIMRGDTEEKVIWNAYINWYSGLEDRNDKQRKSFYLAILALQRFMSLRKNGFLDDYELLYYKGKPCTELSFRIDMGDGFTFRGAVDAVLRHKVTGKILVLECKTSSSSTLYPTTFKNSSQATGYSVVLDVIAPEISSYEVLYLVYLTKDLAYEQLKFTKTYLQRAAWIQELILDMEVIKLYESTGFYPMRGESCNDFFRDCEYLNQCTLSTNLITTPFREESVLDDKVYDIELTLEDLIRGQMNKVISIPEVQSAEAMAQDGDTFL